MSSYSPEVDQKRLTIQADNLQEIDGIVISEAITAVSHKLGKQTLTVLDAGCADGYLTINRFSSYSHLTVIGIDKDVTSINAASQRYGDNRFKFFAIDLEKELIRWKFDLIFCSYLMPHLSNPQNVLQKLWQQLNPKGAMLIRAGDDGWKVNFPESTDMNFLLSMLKDVPECSDRYYGRKIYTHLQSLLPKPETVKIHMAPESTAGMNQEQRASFFDLYYGFRLQYLERVIQKTSDEKMKSRYIKAKQIMILERTRFIEQNDIFSFNLHLCGAAYK